MLKKYTQKFRNEWLNDDNYRNWLQRIEGDHTKCRCKYCKSILNAKLCNIDRHATTTKHKKAMEKFSAERANVVQKTEYEGNTTKKAECTLALFLAAHGAVSLSDHLGNACKALFSDSKSCNDLKLHRTKCSAIICNVLGPYFRKDLVEDVGDGNFSLVIDESNDISTNKLLSLIIRYFSKKKNDIVVSILDLIKMESCNAESICDAIKESLNNNTLSLNNLVGIGTDNASVMVGKHTGVYSRLKAENPNLILMKCVCHSIQLAVSSAAEKTLPRNLDFLVKESYNWFAHSSLRQNKYKGIYATLNNDKIPLKLILCSQTRWLSISKAIDRIHEQWLELKTHFEITKVEERCYNSEVLHSMFSDARNYVYLSFLRPILEDVSRTNKLFESETCDPVKLLNDIQQLITSLISKIVVPGSKIEENTCIKDKVYPNSYLGYLFETELAKINIDDNEKKGIRQRCINFLLELIEQLRSRLPDNCSILKSMCELSVDSCLNPIKSDIIPLAKMFITDSLVLTRVDFQWRQLHTVTWKTVSNKKSSTVKFWAEVSKYKDACKENPFEDLCKFALTILCLPHSNADVERAFSQVTIIKNKLRNKMKVSTINNILSIRHGLKRHGKCCYDFDIPLEVIKKIGTTEVYDTKKTEDENINALNDEINFVATLDKEFDNIFMPVD